MVSRHVMVKFYLWMLLALTLSVGGAATAVGLFNVRHWEERVSDLVLSEVKVGRDIAANLLASGLGADELGRLLEPLLVRFHISVAIVTRDGRPVAVFSEPGRRGKVELPDRDDIEDILAEGSKVELEDPGEMEVGLPIRLPSGEMGVFYVTHDRHHIVGGGFSLQLFIGLVVFLAVLWLLSWPMASHLVRPLRDMARTARALGEGDLSARIRLRRHRRDEVGSLAASFNTMAANLERLVAGHKQLLADISHELRSPLARLRIALELARNDAGTEAQGYLDRVEKQADAMDGLIEELLTHTRLEAAPYALRTEALAPGALLRELSAQFQGDAEQRELRLRTELPVGDPPLRADRALLSRAVSNVLRNALTHTPAGGEVVLETGRDLDRDGERAWIRITDSGGGVSPEMLESIFEPFVRTDSARSPGTGGFGLGLAIARRCMEAHGGGAYAENAAPDGGLRVTLWWPAQRPDSHEAN